MKTILVSMICVICSYSVFAQTHLYENPDFDQIAENHKMIAIIPFKATVTLRPNQMKDISPEQLKNMEVAEGETIQTALFSWFMKRKKRGALTIDVQDPNTTKAMMLRNEINIDNYESYTPKELANLLEVDAIIMGTFETNKPMSEGASVALGVIFGVFGNTNKAVLNLFIYNAEDGVLLVNFNKGVTGSIGSSPDDLINLLMKKASRRIAYTKQGEDE